MRVPVLLVALLSTALLSGCVSDDPQASPVTGSPLMALENIPAGQYQPHTVYAYPTGGMLPVTTDGVTRKVLDDGTVQWSRPAHRALPQPIQGLEANVHVEKTSTGGGIAVFGPLAFIGERTKGPLQVIDISDPAKPKVVGEAADVPVRDADTILYPDGRLIVITTAGGQSQFATDVTDPTKPKLLAAFETPSNNHNIAVVPGTPIVYNTGTDGFVDIIDYSDPAVPVVAGRFFNAHRCHDITFFIDRSTDKYRAYCAAYPETQIWDIADPLRPEIVTRVRYPTLSEAMGIELPKEAKRDDKFLLSFSHLAMVNHDATVLIVGDETGGGVINGCDVYTDATGATTSGPLGNLWFYDITNESRPKLRGHLSPSYQDAVGGSCTAHFGRLIEDTGLLAMGFYDAGVLLVDFQDIAQPRIVDRLDQGGSIWDVQYHQGYLFTGDMTRGMDIAHFVRALSSSARVS